jgi:2-iminobutanoate/2-iminopropanoate deaminase
MEIVGTAEAPAPGGHYSQGIIHDGLVYVSGQLPIVPGSREHRPGSIEEQTERTLKNVQAILRAAGSDLGQLVQLTIYVADMDDWGVVNATVARMLGSHRPARAIVPVGELHHGYGIEIQAIGAMRESGSG